MRKKLLLLFIIKFFGIGAYVNAQSDSSKTLNSEQVIAIVKKYHPVAKLMDFHVKKSEAEITIARGSFNPVVSGSAGSKTLNGTDYYNYLTRDLTIPTWFGIEIYAGLNSLSGNYTDPTQTLGNNSYAGISIPLAKYLLMDKRRAALQQSKVFNRLAYTEQKIMLNNLVMEAMEAYWSWVKDYEQLKNTQRIIAINSKRYELIKQSLKHGERPAIDTVEALGQLQGFIIAEQQQKLQFANSGLSLSTFLWTANNTPFELTEEVKPGDAFSEKTQLHNAHFADSGFVQYLLSYADSIHPEIVQYNHQLEALKIEKKLKSQELLPKINFNYSMLNKGYNFNAPEMPPFENNYLYGIKVEMPLLLSNGRGEFKKIQLKTAETEIKQTQKALFIQNKIKSYFNELNTLKKQIALQQQIVSTSRLMLNAEEARYLNGESSLLMVNLRENKVLESQQKLIELWFKYNKAIYALQWSGGMLIN